MGGERFRTGGCPPGSSPLTGLTLTPCLCMLSSLPLTPGILRARGTLQPRLSNTAGRAAHATRSRRGAQPAYGTVGGLYARPGARGAALLLLQVLSQVFITPMPLLRLMDALGFRWGLQPGPWGGPGAGPGWPFRLAPASFLAGLHTRHACASCAELCPAVCRLAD